MQKNSNKIVNILSKKISRLNFCFCVMCLTITFGIYIMSADTCKSMGVGATISGYDLSSDYLLTVLDDDAACFTCGTNTAYCISLRGTDWHADCVFSNTACSTCQLIKFLLSFSQLLAETWVALQFCIKN